MVSFVFLMVNVSETAICTWYSFTVRSGRVAISRRR